MYVIKTGCPEPLEDLWALLKLGVVDIVRYDGIELTATEIQTIDDAYKKVHGLTRIEWMKSLGMYDNPGKSIETH